MKCVSALALILTLIGALNWGLWGFFQFDLVAWIGHGNTTGVARLIYCIIGLAGLWSLRLLKHCSHLCCGTGKGKSCCK